MKILIAGGSGFIGRELSKYLSSKHELSLLTRSDKNSLEAYHKLITWNMLDQDLISEYDIVVNLCGYNIGKKRWSKAVEKKIISSRIDPTKRLVKLIGEKNIWLINASAIGFYNFSKLSQDEDNHSRNYDNLTFGQEVVDQWEKCLIDSEMKRYTILRFGVVIGQGGVLEKMSMSAKFGFITMFGEGGQYMSWVSIYDLVRAFDFIIDKKLNGKSIFNITAPNASQHIVLVKLLRKYLAKKYIIKIPEPLVKFIFGKMGEELLLSSQNIKSTRLKQLGFYFVDSKIHKALERYI